MVGLGSAIHALPTVDNAVPEHLCAGKHNVGRNMKGEVEKS
jgi:hypothetical protein